MEPETGFEPVTSSLPRRRSTPELLGRDQSPNNSLKVGAGDEARTRDPQLGRLMLYQLSYARSRSIFLQGDQRAAVETVVQGVGFEPT